MTKSLKSILLSLILVLPFMAIPVASSDAITEERIQEITKRLETYSPDQLLDRREFLINALQDEDSESEEGSSESRTSMLLELSIVEQLLIALGILMIDDITGGTSDPQDPTPPPPPPDTTPPVITVLGANPVTIELGDTYVDAGAEADGGETVTTDLGGLDTNVAGTYTITYSATDAAGNTGTATRTVNVVDTVAPVFTSPATFTIDEGSTEIGTISATDAGGVTLFTGDGGSRYEFTGGVDNISSPATLLLSASAISDGYNDFETVESFGCSTGYEANMYTLKARDPSGNETVQNVCIQLNNINDEEPVVTSSADWSVNENQTTVGTLVAIDGDGGLNDLTWSIFEGFGDEDDFVINATTGELSFKVAPDFETKAYYEVAVTVSDGLFIASPVQKITILDVDEDDDTGTGTGTGTGWDWNRHRNRHRHRHLKRFDCN